MRKEKLRVMLKNSKLNKRNKMASHKTPSFRQGESDPMCQPILVPDLNLSKKSRIEYNQK